MQKIRSEERWASKCIEAALPGVRAVHRDTNANDSMYDFDLVRGGTTFASCEVTAAADGRLIELWNLINGSNERWTIPRIAGGWTIAVSPKCIVKYLKRDLPGLLHAMENSRDDAERENVRARLRRLKVVNAFQGETDYPGSIYVTIQQPPERTVGFVAETSDGLVHWLNEWLNSPEQRHNIDKVNARNHPEGHFFVIVPGFTSTPFNASDVLMRNNALIPQEKPRLPEGITDVWIMSAWSSGDLFHYGRGGWGRHVKIFDIEEGD